MPNGATPPFSSMPIPGYPGSQLSQLQQLYLQQAMAQQQQAPQQQGAAGAGGLLATGGALDQLVNYLYPETPVYEGFGELAGQTLPTFGAEATTATAASPWSFSGFGSAGNYLAPAAGAIGAADLAFNHRHRGGGRGALQGAASGAAMGSYFGPWGTGIGAILGGLGGLWKAGKHKDQYARDEIRSDLQQRGFLDPNYNVRLAGGALYNIGKDGGPRAEFGGRRPHEVDFGREGIGNTVGLVNPLAEILTSGDDGLRSNFAGYFTNAASSQGDARANALEMYKNAGINTREQARSMLSQLKAQGKISPFELQVYDQGLVDVFENPRVSAQGALSYKPPTTAQTTPPKPVIQNKPVGTPKPINTKPFFRGR